jgi:hypothetical protein
VVPRASCPVFGGTEGVSSRFHVLRSRTRFRRHRWRRLPFSCFAHPDSFSTIPRASDLFSCFAYPDSFSMISRASNVFFMFCVPRLIFGGTDGVRARFHVFRSRTYFRRCRVRRVTFSCFARPDSFSMIPRSTGPVIMFCAPGLIFGCTEGVGYRFHVLRALTRFRRKRGCRVPFSCLALPESFLAVPRASGPVFKFCALGLVFDGTEGVGSRFHVLCARTRFRRYRGRRVSFSCFAFPELFPAVSRASGPVFKFCALELVFDGTKGVCSCFHVLCSRTHIRRYKGRRLPFSCFAFPELFPAVSRASGLVFMFCAPGLIFGGTE